MVKIKNGQANFMKNGYRFIVKPSVINVYERDCNSDYSLNYSATQNRAAYDSKRYQINKNRNLIDAIQTVLNS